MPRHQKEPHLLRRKPRYANDGTLTHRATWIIKDGNKQVQTGLGIECLDEAKKRLHEYNLKKYQEQQKYRVREENEITVSELTQFYLESNADRIREMKSSKAREFEAQVKRLLEFWGGLCVSNINALASGKYKEGRNPNSVRHELVLLRAIVNFGSDQGVYKQILKRNYAIPPEAAPKNCVFVTRGGYHSLQSSKAASAYV